MWVVNFLSFCLSAVPLLSSAIWCFSGIQLWFRFCSPQGGCCIFLWSLSCWICLIIPKIMKFHLDVCGFICFAVFNWPYKWADACSSWIWGNYLSCLSCALHCCSFCLSGIWSGQYYVSNSWPNSRVKNCILHAIQYLDACYYMCYIFIVCFPLFSVAVTEYVRLFNLRRKVCLGSHVWGRGV